MTRVRADYVFGTTTAPIGTSDTTLSSAELSRLPAITAPDIAAITLTDGTSYEVVHVTAHTASATTATIVRGREGSTARSWASGTTWDHGATSADFARAGLPVFDAVDYGAKVDGTTDDTTAWQNAINAAAAAGGGRVISSKNGVSIIGGALQDTSGANAQILLPSIDAGDSEQITIAIEGAVQPPSTVYVIGPTPVPDNHLVLKSTLTSGSGAVIGAIGPAGTYSNFTNLQVALKNLTVRTPANPTITALDLRNVTTADLDHVIVDAGSYDVLNLTEPTTAGSFGIRLPKLDNGAHSRLAWVDVVGFYNGIDCYEHTIGEVVAAWGCKQGLVFNLASHASKFQRLMTVHCQKGLVFTGGAHYVDVDQFNVEHAATGWHVPTADIDDPSNYGRGTITWHVVKAGVGVDSTFTKNGAANLVVNRLGTAFASAVYKGRDRLVATAGNNTLTLGATPVQNSPLVWVNGAIKWPSTDYTISGAVITFTSALAASDVVQVIYDTTTASPAASALSTVATVVVADTFDRANSTSSLGTTTTGSKAWTAQGGTWGINSNRAYISSGGAGVNTAVVDAAVTNCTVKMTVAANATNEQPGLCVRMTDANNGYVIEGGQATFPAKIYKGVSGTWTQIAASGSNLAFVAGDVIEVVLSGSSITVKRNGTTIITATDSTYTTQTKHGLYMVAASGASPTLRIDDFTVSA